MSMRKSFCVMPVCLLMAACGSANKPDSGDQTRVQLVSLSAVQQKSASDGVREMVANMTASGGESAKTSGLIAFTLPPKSGVHVCGDVSYQMEPGKAAVSAPYYLELENKEGLPVAKRGQVGSDKLKKSKVNFMCRHMEAG